MHIDTYISKNLGFPTNYTLQTTASAVEDFTKVVSVHGVDQLYQPTYSLVYYESHAHSDGYILPD
jgi:hypothetical protein